MAQWVTESVIVYMDVCHGSVGQSVHTAHKDLHVGGATLVAMATTFGLGAESSRLPACHIARFYFIQLLRFLTQFLWICYLNIV